MESGCGFYKIRERLELFSKLMGRREGYEFQNVGGILFIKALGDASSTVTEKREGMNGVAGDVVALVVES